jgi:hypothetical protein
VTRNKKWFSNLTPLSHKEYVTFGDDKKCKVKTKGIINVNEYFPSKVIASVEHLKYKLFSSSLVIDDGLEISFLGVMLFVGLILMEIWFVAFLGV